MALDRGQFDRHPVRATFLRSRSDGGDHEVGQQYSQHVLDTGRSILELATVPDLLRQFRDALRGEHPDIRFPGYTDQDLVGGHNTKDHDGVVYQLRSEGRVATRLGWDYSNPNEKPTRDYEYAGVEIGAEPLTRSLIVTSAINLEIIPEPIWQNRNGSRILTAAIHDAMDNPNYYSAPISIG